MLPFNTAFNTPIQSSKYVLQFSQIIELFASKFFGDKPAYRIKDREMVRAQILQSLAVSSIFIVNLRYFAVHNHLFKYSLVQISNRYLTAL